MKEQTELESFLNDYAVPSYFGLIGGALGGPPLALVFGALGWAAKRDAYHEEKKMERYYHLVGKWIVPKPPGVSIRDVVLYFDSEDAARTAFNEQFSSDTDRKWTLHSPTAS